jgi:KaiC/GvpD/RAD55 family RecA-like ATPase
MTAIRTISPHLTSIQAPPELRSLVGWVIWRSEHNGEETKPRKVPYYAGGGRRHGVQGRPEDRQQLVTFDAAVAAAARRGFDGVGLALMPEFGVTALDFDACVAAGMPEVLRLVGHTYAEYSPSGQGVRAFVLGSLGDHKDHGQPFGFETFSAKGFVTFTGNALPHVADLDLLGSTIASADDDLRAYCARRFGTKARAVPAEDDDPLDSYSPQLGLTLGQLAEAMDVLPGELSYDAWVNVGMAVHHETGGSDEGFAIWDEWSARSPKYSNTEYSADRWRSFGNRGGRVVTARSLVKLANENGARINVSAVDLAAFEQAPAKKPESKPARFPLVQAAAFAGGAPPRWIVKGMLPQAELVVIYGAPGSGKTFAVLDLAAAIARGIDWRGLKVRQGRVIYVAAEGSGGLRKRLEAYARHHGIDLELMALWVIPAAPNLLLKDDALELSRAIAALGPADLVVIDTLAQVTPGGNENAAEDMGKALAHCKGIHRATGATVLLVHHSGKDASRGSRGWSGILGAADAEFEVARLGAARVLRNTKQKDGVDGSAWAFDLRELVLDLDEDGDEVSSCVVVEAAMPAVGTLAKPLGKHETIVNAVIQEFAQAQTTGIEVAAVLAEAVRRMPAPEDGKRDTRKQHARRALMALCEGDEAPYLVEDDCLSVM